MSFGFFGNESSIVIRFYLKVTRELLMNRSNRLKRYSYSSSSDEEISETMERVVI